jgi:hypothetical protein
MISNEVRGLKILVLGGDLKAKEKEKTLKEQLAQMEEYEKNVDKK